MIHIAAIAWLASTETQGLGPAHTALDRTYVELEIVLPAIGERSRELAPTLEPAIAATEPAALPAEPARDPAALPAAASRKPPVRLPALGRDEPDTPVAAPSGTSLSMRGSTGPGPAAVDREQPPGHSGPAAPFSPFAAAQRAAAAIEDKGPTPLRSPLEAPGARIPPERQSRLIPDGGGTHRYEESVFTAKIGRDGRVAITDRRNFRPGIGLAPGLAEHRNRERGYGDPNGISGEQTMRKVAGTIPVLHATFDLTDWLMRSVGNDPYSPRKARFLDETREERAELAAADARETMRDVLAELGAYLQATWADTRMPAPERRRILFALWDECAESGSPELVSASQRARATIMAFIRKHLPAGSQDAYTAAELEAYSRRKKSRAQFAPYHEQ